MSFELARALRRIKPQRAADALRRRPVTDLALVDAAASAGPELLLDTCVYIDVPQGRTPQGVDDLLQAARRYPDSIGDDVWLWIGQFVFAPPMHRNVEQERQVDWVQAELELSPDQYVGNDLKSGTDRGPPFGERERRGSACFGIKDNGAQ